MFSLHTRIPYKVFSKAECVVRTCTWSDELYFFRHSLSEAQMELVKLLATTFWLRKHVLKKKKIAIKPDRTPNI